MSSLIDTNEKDFDSDVLESQIPVLVDFWASWCAPCKMQTPILEKVQQKIGDKAKIIKLNTDENPGIAQKYSVSSIPTLILFKEGKIVEQMVGVQSDAVIMEKLSSL